MLRDTRDRLQGEKCVVDGLADVIETDLNVVQEFMQAAIDDFPNLDICELGRKTAQPLLCVVSKSSNRSS